jgi:two-component system CheB/CheR fusion protein
MQGQPRRHIEEYDSALPPSIRVMVVDDDVDTVSTLALLLRDEGFEVMTATTAAQMWRSLMISRPDAILLDIGLPDDNGYALARRLREEFRDRCPALIAVTASNRGSDKILAQLSGFRHHIGKPYDPSALIATLRSITLDYSARPVDSR